MIGKKIGVKTVSMEDVPALVPVIFPQSVVQYVVWRYRGIL